MIKGFLQWIAGYCVAIAIFAVLFGDLSGENTFKITFGYIVLSILSLLWANGKSGADD